MAAAELKDGGKTSGPLKFANYMEEVPNVNRYFLSRCMNAVDSEFHRAEGGVEPSEARIKYLTFVKALRTLARRICLDPSENLSPRKTAQITRTRQFLGPGFFKIMGFYGVDIINAGGVWSFTESGDAEETSLLQDLAKQFHSKDKGVRVALCHLMTNLTWRDDRDDEDSSRQRAGELKKLGLLTKLETLESDDEELGPGNTPE